MIIYRVVCKINNKCYIGITKHKLNKRKNQHLNLASHHNSQTIFHKALRKYGAENFVWEIIEYVDNRSDAEKKEIYYIEQYNSLYTANGYNTANGYVNPFYSKTEKTKKEKIPWNKGLTDIYSQQSLKRMSDSLKKTWKENGHPLVSIKMSDESKALMSASKKNKTYEQIYGVDTANKKKEKYKQTILSKNLNKTHLTEQELVQMKNEFLQGTKIKKLSKKYKIHFNTVTKKLIKMGITQEQFEENKKSRRSSYKKISETDQQTILRLKNDGISISKISSIVNIPKTRIGNFLRGI